MSYFPIEIPEKQKVFVGREDELNKINDLFKSKQILAISAFGGTGKSTLALEYCHKLIENNHNSTIRWLNAASSFQLEAEFKQLAELLEINLENFQIDFIIRKTYSKLEELNQNILLVFDNVESYADIKEYVGRVPLNIKILITTRDQLNLAQIDKIELHPFNINEADAFIHKNIDSRVELNHERKQKIIELSKSTQNEILPITIELIVRYLNTYIDIKGVDQMLDDVIKCDYHNRKIETVLFLDLKLDDELALKLLQYCSFLNPDFIEKRILYDLIDVKINKELKLNNSLSKLNKLSLITFVKKSKLNGVKVHRLIQDELKNFISRDEDIDATLVKNEAIHDDLVKYLDEKFDFVNQEPANCKKNEQGYLHSLSVYENTLALAKINTEKEDTIEANLNIVQKLYLYEYYLKRVSEKSLAKAKRAYELRKKLNEDTDDLVMSLKMIAMAYAELFDYSSSLEYLLKAIEAYKGGDSLLYARLLDSITATYNKLNKHKTAFEYGMRAFEMQQRVLNGKENIDMAITLNNLAFTCSKLTQPAKALEYQLKAVEIMNKIYDKNHPDLAVALSNIGRLYGDLNQHRLALDYKLKSLDMMKRLYGDMDHINLIAPYDNLARSYFELKDHAKSLEYQLKAIEMMERVCVDKKENPILASMYNNAGIAYGYLNQFEKGLGFLFKSLDIANRIYGDRDHLEKVIFLAFATEIAHSGRKFRKKNLISNHFIFNETKFIYFETK